MKSLDDCSGKWVGWSIQGGRRIHETMDLVIKNGRLRGTGEDADGRFDLDGGYGSTHLVRLVRAYSYCTAGEEGVGIPYDYLGQWDGGAISGQWSAPHGVDDGGTFEMWPEDGDESYDLSSMAREMAGSR